MELNVSYLNLLKEQSGLTLAQISERSQVPIGTVKRVFSGSTEAPTLATIVDIVDTLNGSMNELCGIKIDTKPKEQHSGTCSDCASLASSREAYQHAYEAIKAQHEIELKRVKEYLTIKDKWLFRMFVYCIVITVIYGLLAVLK